VRVVGRTLDITPERRGLLFSGPSQAPWVSVHSRLECNLSVIREGSTPLTVVSLDLLYPGLLPELIDPLLPAEIDRKAIVYAASHTHHGPPTDPDLWRLGSVDEEYLTLTARKIAVEITRAHSDSDDRATGNVLRDC
jgi:hypothetical protein